MFFLERAPLGWILLGKLYPHVFPFELMWCFGHNISTSVNDNAPNMVKNVELINHHMPFLFIFFCLDFVLTSRIMYFLVYSSALNNSLAKYRVENDNITRSYSRKCGNHPSFQLSITISAVSLWIIKHTT